jgi:mono/diheme cytochrome c family protein
MNFFDTRSSVWQCYDQLAGMIMTKRALILCCGVAFAASIVTVFAADKKAVDVSKIPPASDKKGVTYEADIKPIFEKSCVKCHGAEKQKGKLRLDSLAATLKGGEDGKVIEAGDSAKSMLVHNVAHVGDEDMFMPPPDNKDKIPQLTKEQVGLIRAWIDQGAK